MARFRSITTGSWDTPKRIPVVAFVDPEMMASMPKGLTAATGMDALTHAIEGYITAGAWELSDMFS